MSHNVNTTLYCSFCGKSEYEINRLIPGGTVLICEECVFLCLDIYLEDGVLLIKTEDGKHLDVKKLDLVYQIRKPPSS